MPERRRAFCRAAVIPPLFFCLAGAFAAPLSAQSPAGEGPGVAALLAGFLEHDTALQEAAIKARQAELALRRSGIEQGFNLTLSSGTMRLEDRGGEAALSAEPGARVSFPALNDSSVSVTVPLAKDGADAGLSARNTRLSASTALTGPAPARRRLALAQAERAALEARRALSRRARQAEKEFFEALLSLYEGQAQILTREESAYTKEIDLAVVRAQGYSPSSARYRAVELEAAEAFRAASQQRREQARKTARFARDCGLDALAELPGDLPPSLLEDAPPFGGEAARDRYTGLESARWNQYAGGLAREAARRLELSAQGGLTLNSAYVQGGASADAGLSLNWKGLSVSAETAFPLSGEGRPAFTLAIGLDVNSRRAAALDGEEKRLAAESEALALRAAARDWEAIVEAARAQRSDLLWEKERLAVQYALYEELARDAGRAFRGGLAAESEWRKAEANEGRLRYQMLAQDARLLIHLIEADLYLVEE